MISVFILYFTVCFDAFYERLVNNKLISLIIANICLPFSTYFAIIRQAYPTIARRNIMSNINAAAEKIYNYLCERISEGVPPSVREICTELNIKSTSTVHRYLKILEENGYIERAYNQNRYIKLNVQSGDKTFQVPLVGTVTAGIPITAIEYIEDYVPFKSSKYALNELFALKVRGESMINAGIISGDLIIIHKTSTALNGDIVVAMIDDEATVKTFYKENGHYRLQPENDTMQPIIASNVEILGKVISLIRSYE